MISSPGFEYRNRLVKNILHLFITSSRGKPRTQPFLLLSRLITQVLHHRPLHLLIVPPSNVSYGHSVRGAADAPYSPIAHSPHTGPALDRSLPSLPAPATSLLTRCSKPPGRRAGALAEPWARKSCCNVNSTSKAALKKLRDGQMRRDGLNFPRLVLPALASCVPRRQREFRPAVHSRHAKCQLSRQSSTFVCQQ